MTFFRTLSSFAKIWDLIFFVIFFLKLFRFPNSWKLSKNVLGMVLLWSEFLKRLSLSKSHRYGSSIKSFDILTLTVRWYFVPVNGVKERQNLGNGAPVYSRCKSMMVHKKSAVKLLLTNDTTWQDRITKKFLYHSNDN